MSRSRPSEADLKCGWPPECDIPVLITLLGRRVPECRTDTARLAEAMANRETEAARRGARMPLAMAAIIAS